MNYQQPLPPRPNNYMTWAILSTLCCCTPLGIVAIINASRVNSLYLSGNYSEACHYAAEAKKWCILSVILGIVSFGIYGGITYL